MNNFEKNEELLAAVKEIWYEFANPTGNVVWPYTDLGSDALPAIAQILVGCGWLVQRPAPYLRMYRVAEDSPDVSL